MASKSRLDAVARGLAAVGCKKVADILETTWPEFDAKAATAIPEPLQRYFVWSAARFQFRGDREAWHRDKMPTGILTQILFEDVLAWRFPSLSEAARASLSLATGPAYTMAHLSVCPKATFVTLSGLAPDAAADFWDSAQAICDEG